MCKISQVQVQRLSPVSAGAELLKMMKISAVLARADHAPSVLLKTLAAVS